MSFDTSEFYLKIKHATLGQKSNFLLFCIQGNVQDRAGNVQDRAGNVQDRAEFPAEFPVLKVQDRAEFPAKFPVLQEILPCPAEFPCTQKCRKFDFWPSAIDM